MPHGLRSRLRWSLREVQSPPLRDASLRRILAAASRTARAEKSALRAVPPALVATAAPESSQRVPRPAHHRLQLRIRVPPRLDHERILARGFVAAAESIEDPRALHRPDDVVESVAARGGTWP